MHNREFLMPFFAPEGDEGGSVNTESAVAEQSTPEVEPSQPTADDMFAALENGETFEVPGYETETEKAVEQEEDTQESAEKLPKEVSEAQSDDKEHPANHEFASLRRTNKELEAAKNSLNSINKAFADLAKSQGFDNINSAQEYVDALVKQDDTFKMKNLAEKYKKTQDPMTLVEMVKMSNAQDNQQPQVQQQPAQQQQEMVKQYAEVEYNNAVKAELDAFNTEFGYELKSIEDVRTLPNSDKIIDIIKTSPSLSLSDAHMLANRNNIIESREKAARQKALNQAKGLSHINNDKPAGSVENITVSDEEVQNHMAFFNVSPSKARETIMARKKAGTYM